MSLTVFSSSAGSGKTTTLVTEYLKLALANPPNFRQILAITFTNKAANEMKSRVIDTLKIIIEKEDIPGKILPLINDLNLDIKVIKERANILLTLILHNYDDFSISTIDSFTHRIIRTFATDVELPQNFEVVVDNNDIIPDIVKDLFEKVGYDKELTKVLIDFAISETDDEKNYDLTKSIIGFIKHHFNEDSYEHIKQLASLNISDLGEISRTIRKKIKLYKEDAILAASKALELCNKNNIYAEDLYQGGRGIYGYFSKLQKFDVKDESLFPGKQAQKTIAENQWYSKKTNENTASIIESIIDDLTNFYNTSLVCLREYLFLRLLYSKIYSLTLIHEIKNIFDEFTISTGKVHISEFNKRISKQIANQPVPFIYERLGRRYRYFMIDEFQDTSVLQWQNLLPLIEESLAYSNLNLLVGDSKQAIYRFRNGEVELFANLPELINNDGSQLFQDRQNTIKREFVKKNLTVNYRSLPQIVNFNNDFFKQLSETLSVRTKNIYSDVSQQVPKTSSKGGFVNITLIDSESKDDYTEKKNDHILDSIKNLFDKKFKKSDICILCRTKNNASNIAQYLLDNNIDVVSSESLLITNSPSVRLIIAFFELKLNADDSLALASFIENYLTINDKKDRFHNEFMEIKKTVNHGIGSVLQYLNINTPVDQISSYSIYELAEFIIREIIKLNKSDVFVQYLLDFIYESKLTLADFVEKWHQKKDNLFIKMPDNIDAVKIMTIHKAKGLDFPVVFVDAENTKNKNTKSEFWEEINITDIEKLKVGLFPLNKKLEHINKMHYYEVEQQKTELDFFNLIYVAFTRPSVALYAIAQSKSNEVFSSYLRKYLELSGIFKDDQLSYSFGDLETNINNNEETVENELTLDNFISTNWTDVVKISKSESFDEITLMHKSSKSFGNLVHSILSGIKTIEDVEFVSSMLVQSNIIPKNEIDIILSIINSVVDNDILKKYFSKDVVVKNENEILLETGQVVRPDRIVFYQNKVIIMDYKTGEQKDEDKAQIDLYKNALKCLGYNNIEAMLIYLGDEITIINV